MLLKLMIIRLGPLIVLGFMKEKKQLKHTVYILLAALAFTFTIAVVSLLENEKGKALLYLPFVMSPQCLFYVFSVWILFRCVRNSWSTRVWKRIYYLSVFSTVIGVITEKYCNPIILRLFFKFFK